MLTIGLLVYRDMQALDLAGPLDVFGTANGHTEGGPPYRLHTIGLTAAPVQAENGLTLVPEFDLDDAPALDTLLVPGGAGSRRVNADVRLLAWLRERAATTRRVASVCTGIYILAATGMLDGQRVTTHWRFAADVAKRFPLLDVEPDALFLRNGRFATSGGLTAGIDLALALVQEDLGATVSLKVARDLLMYVKRPGNQSQFSAPLAAQSSDSGRLEGLVDWLLQHLDETLTVNRMADHMAMSPRNFRRVFIQAFRVGPARFVEQLRLEQACLRLAGSAAPIERIASSTGFNSADAFRRAFRGRYGTSPVEYRNRFG
jgi:transcriptional regulator GlxA family with amidase domain